MPSLRRVVMFVLAFGLLVGSPLVATARSITIVDARKIALARVPGTIVHEKTKKKKKHTIFNIKIRPRDAAPKSELVKKVEIDATSGQIIKIKDAKAKANDD